jgi:LysM repeat protein
MLSSNASNGAKHRRARRTALGALAVTGAGVALPLLATGAAHADSSVWDRVAACESSGNWSINTGNGFYGGLQFTESTWLAYGGGQYAQYANDASPAQQIAVAEKVLAGQGPGAWPVCGPRAGLSSADVNDQGAPAASNYQQTSAPQQTQQVQQQAPAQQPQQNDNDSAPVTYTATSSTKGGYVVHAGDTLSEIAATHGVRGGWEHLYALNKSVVGANPNLIFPGQHLVF